MTEISPRATYPARMPARDGLTVAQVPAVLRRSWAWIAVPTLAAALASGVFVQVVAPRYTGAAQVLLESREAAFARTAQERSDQVTPPDEQAVASQVQVMMSRDLAREAIRRLKLVGNPEFDPSAGEAGPVKRLLMLLGIAPNPLDRPAEDRVLDTYFDRLLVYPAGKSRIISVEFRSRDADLAAAGANTVAELYLASLEAAKVDTARYASTWLGGNIESLRKRVAEAEAKVEAFRARNGLVAAPGTTGQPLTAQQLGELSTQLSQARTIQADLGGRLKAIKEMIKDGRAFEIPDVANNEVVRRTVENRIAVRAQLALESRTLLPAHPRIKELTAQVTDLDQQIKAAAERIVRTMENDQRIAAARVESLKAAVDGQREVVVKGNASEIELRALEREAKAQREQLESYLARYREASAREAETASPADARIVSRAVRPELPSFPKKVPIVAFATLLALMLSAGAVIGRRLLADPDGGPRPEDEPGPSRRPSWSGPERFTYPEPLPPGRWPGAAPAAATAALAESPVLPEAAASGPAGLRGAAPVEAHAAALAAIPPAAPPAASPAPSAEPPGFDLGPLIGRLQEGPRRGGGRLVLVVETPAQVRGTGLSHPLAGSLSALGTTLEIDVNGPEDEAEEAGLTDLVAGEAAFAEVIQPTRDRRLQRIATGRFETAALLAEPEALAIALEAASEAYDWVVCRLRLVPGPVALVPALARHMDSVVLASNAPAEDPELGDLFGLAEDAGAGQVLVAQDRPARRADPDGLRRTAA
ncbi:GumC family protein [uncultured Methylobacterium sp.]|uniref:GumC family protein n=1 Tax=uncultured Methylobacterium sp. TaxID=157278 RepID=UPI002592F808|nr:GumC family protein [uncultured Methylobacterium sp.]